MDRFHLGAFWSYSHEDDKLDSGKIQLLAQKLTNEYSLMTGEGLEIFVDRSSILWGNAWRERIDEALGTTTFFIPVLSPRYFTRPECRDEMLAFHRRAQALKIDDVLLPILYVSIPDFCSSNPDELIALASRYQYVDWTANRLSSEESSEFRSAVNQLAGRLFSLSSSIGTTLLSREIAVVDEGDDAEVPGLLEHLNAIGELLPDWLECVEMNEANDAQFAALYALLGERVKALERRPGQGQARFATLQRFANESMPLALRLQEAAAIYLRRSVDLDPLVLQVLQSAYDSGDPNVLENVGEIFSVIRKAKLGIEKTKKHQLRPDGMISQWFRKRAHVSRLVAKLAGTLESCEKTISEGNVIVDRWLDGWDLLLTELKIVVPGQPTGEPSLDPRDYGA